MQRYLDTAAERSNCILSTKKLESTGIEIPNANIALKELVKKYTEK